jgi:hypothetical protein
MTMDTVIKRKRNFRSINILLMCWKRRRFQYLEEDETREDPIIEDRLEPEVEPSSNPIVERSSNGPLDTPLAPCCSAQSSGNEKMHPVQLTSSLDSFQESIESMDSLSGSDYNQDDNSTSQATARVSNCHGETYLMEHLHFLSVSTQPQEVELMYDNVTPSVVDAGSSNEVR